MLNQPRISETVQPRSIDCNFESHLALGMERCEPIEGRLLGLIDQESRLATHRCQLQRSTPTISDARYQLPGAADVFARGRVTFSVVLNIGFGGDTPD